MLNLFWRLFFVDFDKPAKPVKEKRNLFAFLLDQILSLPLIALRNKWTEDLWKPVF